MQEAVTIYTVGHSTRPIEDFVALLRGFDIALVADVRTVPQSRRNPQFGQASLRQALAGAGIDYRHLKGLGGLRRPRKDSINTAWRNDSFRGYADYMQTPEFAAALAELWALAAERRTAVMCAEAVPWRCHRSLIGDALLVRGAQVVDIMDLEQAKPHALTRFAQVEGTTITYPA
ncbi:MAG TPA: DUF488 domain-containing protein [Gammaproteobacteria bacterium]